MRWGRVVALATFVAGVAAGFLGVTYRDEIRVALALRRCHAAWGRVNEYWSDIRVNAALGPVGVTVDGVVGYRRPDAYVVELRRDSAAYCRILRTNPRSAVAIFPGAEVAVEVEFAPAAAGAPVSSLTPEPWIEQLAEGEEFRWIGREAVDGRRCTVLELAPSPEQTRDGSLIVAPVLGRRFADVPFLGSWERTRVYLDDETDLPIRGEALKESGAVLFAWAARNARVNQGLPAGAFEADLTGMTVLRRTYDPAHPERLFLPPGSGRSLLRRLGDVLEEEVKEYLGNDGGDRARDEEAPQPAPE